MQQQVVLEFYAESEEQLQFLETVVNAHQKLVASLAPHLGLEIRPLVATHIERFVGSYQGTEYNVPNQRPSAPNYQSLLLTRECFGWPGLAGPGKGCVNEQALRAKVAAGADPADVTVHEWLHTLEGLVVCGHHMPSPDSNTEHPEFTNASGRAADGDATWHAWYRFLLRGCGDA